MSATQAAVTVAVVVLGTVLTRFLPYALVPRGRQTPPFLRYLGAALAPAVFGLLVVYCLRNVSLTGGSHGIPEAAALLVVWATYAWKRQMILSMAAGTAVYMLLVQLVFAS
ncbi:MAG: AzlD domain-containing protein [Coriobacteriales bacterium]|jgi:branched-subunit amino acid transport protein AzlD